MVSCTCMPCSSASSYLVLEDVPQSVALFFLLQPLCFVCIYAAHSIDTSLITINDAVALSVIPHMGQGTLPGTQQWLPASALQRRPPARSLCYAPSEPFVRLLAGVAACCAYASRQQPSPQALHSALCMCISFRCPGSLVTAILHQLVRMPPCRAAAACL